jgi:UDP-N-acetylmuramoyl-tripeptide--D-alanyl-D-alanine ligase
VAAGVDLVFTAGELMEHLYNMLPAPKQGGHVDEALELAELLAQHVRAGDILLIKGSHGSKMYQVAEKLIQGVSKEIKNAI